MRRFAQYAAAVLTLTLVFAASDDAAAAAPRHDAYPLHLRSAGPRVCDAQWLLMANRPSVYRSKRYRVLSAGKPSCYFGPRTGKAVVKLKRRLGYPNAYLRPVFGKTIYRYLTGRQRRPLGYIARAGRRLADEVRKQNAARLTYAARIVRLAQGELGCREIPDGSNYSTCIRKYQAVTGAYRAAWCVSFTQWLFSASGLGAFASRSAGVYYVVGYGRARGWLRSTPKPGLLVAFLDRQGHIGLVEKVVSGGIQSIEGNASNQVLRRFHPLRNHRPKVYLEVPGIQRPLPARPTPRGGR